MIKVIFKGVFFTDSDQVHQKELRKVFYVKRRKSVVISSISV